MEASAGKIGLLEISTGKVGLLRIGSFEVKTLEVGIEETDPLEIALTNVLRCLLTLEKRIGNLQSRLSILVDRHAFAS